MKAKMTSIVTLFFLLSSLFSNSLYSFAQNIPDTDIKTLSINDTEFNVNDTVKLNFNIKNKNDNELRYKIRIPETFEYATANNQIFSDNSINFDTKSKEIEVNLTKQQYKNFSLEFIVKDTGKYTIYALDQITGESTNFNVNVSADNKKISETNIVSTEENINNNSDIVPRLVGDTPMKNFPNTEVIQANSTAMIDGKYAFVPTISPNTTSTLNVIKGSSHSSDTTISNSATPYFWVSADSLNEVEYEVAFENVGYYNGNRINMTYHVTASNTSRSNINGMVTNVNYIGTGTNIGGPNIDLAQYNFFDENWNPIALSGNISMFNIQTNKELQIDKDQFDKFYISSDSQLGYTNPKTEIFTDTITNVMPQNSAPGTNNQTGFTALFSNKKTLSFSSLASSKEAGGNTTSAQLGIAVTPEYSLVTVALPPPNKDGFDINEVTDKDNLIYTGSQIIPTIDGTNTSKYFSSFIMEDQLDNVLIVNKEKIVIKNGKGTDVTNNFNVTLDSSNKLTLSANPSVLNTASFYGTTLYIYIYGHLDYSKNLTSYINGNKIVVPNTITTIANRLNSSTIEGGTSNIANATFPDLVSVSGTKTWDDANNQDEKRPDSVSINLLANGTKVDSKTVSATDDWKYSFTNLDKYKDGTEIIYTVTEDTVPDYTTSIDGTDITNSYTPGKTNVSVTKAWNDSNNQDGLRPNKITVQLYADGKESGKPVELNSSNDWTITWDNLDLKQSGKEIAYTVKEVDTVAGYTTTTDDTDKGNIIITNTHNTKGRKTGYIPINKNNNKFDSPLTKLLPKTGEMKNFIFSVIGVLVLLILFTFYIIRKYKKTRM